MSAIHLLYRAPWEVGSPYVAPTGDHFWHFAHSQPTAGLRTKEGATLRPMPSMMSDPGKRGWVGLAMPVLHAVIPEYGNRPRYARIATLLAGRMTLEQFAGWHHEVARRVREMIGAAQVLAVWDECDYFRLQQGEVLRLEYEAVLGSACVGNPFALERWIR